MLQLIGISLPVEERLELDGYTIGIEWDEERYGNVYWRTGDMRATLLEVGIEFRERGRLKRLNSVISPSPYALDPTDEQLQATWNNGFTGIPHFDLSVFPRNNYLDEPASFTLGLDDERLRITFISELQVTKCLFSGKRTYFGFDQHNYLTTIEMVDITPVEISQIRETLLRSPN